MKTFWLADGSGAVFGYYPPKSHNITKNVFCQWIVIGDILETIDVSGVSSSVLGSVNAKKNYLELILRQQNSLLTNLAALMPMLHLKLFFVVHLINIL